MKITNPQNTEEYIRSKKDFSGWFNEAIWGHRLERQPASALLLEFLSMAEAMYRDGRLLEPIMPGDDYRFKANRSIWIRSLLFNNPRMEQIRVDCQGSEDDAWETWLDDMRQRAAVGDSFTADFSYLREQFHSFSDLSSRVVLLRRIVMDPGSGRKWTNQLLFPIGPAALYEPCDEKLSRDRTLFTRTGEIAYLMLTRASERIRNDLVKKLSLLFDENTPRNNLLTSLLPESSPDKGSEKGGTYLPYKTHPAFNRLAEDINNLLSLGLPDQDVLEHLSPIIAFNLYIYAIETPNHWLDQENIPVCACEILGPKMDVARRASIVTKEENEELGLRAIRNFVDQGVSSNSELKDRLSSSQYTDESKAQTLADHLSEAFFVDKELIKSTNPEQVRREVISIAERSYREGVLSAIQGLGAAAGFTDRRGTNKRRYCPTDKLLRALILANVTNLVKEDNLLECLNKRYHLVIGPREAKSELPSFFHDESDFKKNKERFTGRLAGLGLAHRMSDACTYVRNPYFRNTA